MGQALTKGVQPGAANAKEVGAAPTVGETKTDMTQHDKSTDKPKPCCACPETKKARDECFLLSGDNAEIACKDLIEAHRKCMRQYDRPASGYAQIVGADVSDSVAYDLVLSDGQKYLKVAAHPKLHKMIRTGFVTVKQIILVKNYKVVELGMAGSKENERVVILTGLSVVTELPNFDVVKNVTEFVDGVPDRQKGPKPLITARGAYLGWYDDSCFVQEDDRWDDCRIFETTEPILPSSPTLSDIEEIYKQEISNGEVKVKRAKVEQSPLLGRITGKTALIFYGKLSDKTLNYPYKFEFQLSDESGCMLCVVWNDAALRHYKHLNVGDVVQIKGYRIKSRQNDPNELEVVLNSGAYGAKIEKLSAESIDDWDIDYYKTRFPWLTTALTPLDKLIKLPNGTESDIVARVVYLSDLKVHGAKGDYHALRYALLDDGSTSNPVLMTLYANSQEEKLFNLTTSEIIKTKVVVNSTSCGSKTRTVWLVPAAFCSVVVWNEKEYAKFKGKCMENGASNIPPLDDFVYANSGFVYAPIPGKTLFDLTLTRGEDFESISFNALEHLGNNLALHHETEVILPCFVQDVKLFTEVKAQSDIMSFDERTMEQVLSSWNKSDASIEIDSTPGETERISLSNWSILLKLVDFSAKYYVEAAIIPNAAELGVGTSKCAKIDTWFDRTLSSVYPHISTGPKAVDTLKQSCKENPKKRYVVIGTLFRYSSDRVCLNLKKIVPVE